ncbi:hypothetical protein Zmor_024258 [Zophobas morio]|uniref:Uncharacterized protein n=1 Tax=Zophobas morio TaxID=2755281 RepID=A0AA38I0H2_9CUCU|nr:hypothetical protein Zmor_024258 [Zophobas morio]
MRPAIFNNDKIIIELAFPWRRDWGVLLRPVHPFTEKNRGIFMTLSSRVLKKPQMYCLKFVTYLTLGDFEKLHNKNELLPFYLMCLCDESLEHNFLYPYT